MIKEYISEHSPDSAKRFLREAKILASLFEIPGIVKVLDYFQEEERAYCVMEYVRGISLRSYLERREEPLTFEESWQMLLTVLRSLEKSIRRNCCTVILTRIICLCRRMAA